MSKGWIIVLGIFGVIVLVFCVIMAIATRETVIDYKCNQLSKEEFYKEVRCKKYWD